MKVIYNVTIKIDTSLSEDWLLWMKTVHIPAVMATGCFESCKLTRILGDDDEHGVGFAIQYIAISMSEFERYQSGHASHLQGLHSARYNGRYAAFRTLMEVVHEI
jgi:hypothetical protein